MRSTFNEPRFFLLSQPLAGKEANCPQSWLGKVVRFVDRPWEGYAPDEVDTEKLISKYILDPLYDLDVEAVINSVKDKSLQMKLTALFTFSRESHNERQVQLETLRMATIGLRQQEFAFNALMADPKINEETVRLLHRSGRRAYMIVGVKMVFKGSVKLITNSGINTGMTLEVPVSEIASAAAGSPLPVVPNVINPQLAAHTHKERNVDMSYRFDEGRIFAMEYKEVVLKKPFMASVSQGPTFLPEIPDVSWGVHRFSGGKTKTDFEKASGEDVGIERPTLLAPRVSVADIGQGGIGWQEYSVHGSTGTVAFAYECPDEDSEESDIN
jgi:hypothetical protein